MDLATKHKDALINIGASDNGDGKNIIDLKCMSQYYTIHTLSAVGTGPTLVLYIKRKGSLGDKKLTNR